jgi:hypothetical protein
MLSLLLDCTVKMLQLLYDAYETQRITYDVFEEHIKVKMTFLKDNIDYLKSNEGFDTMWDIFGKCHAVISYNSSNKTLSNFLLSSNTTL